MPLRFAWPLAQSSPASPGPPKNASPFSFSAIPISLTPITGTAPVTRNASGVQQQVIGDLAERRVPYFILRGTLNARIERVAEILARYQKFGNILDLRDGAGC